MIDHPTHVRNARLAIAEYDRARTGKELSKAAVQASEALRVLLYEPADEYQGAFVVAELKGV